MCWLLSCWNYLYLSQAREMESIVSLWSEFYLLWVGVCKCNGDKGYHRFSCRLWIMYPLCTRGIWDTHCRFRSRSRSVWTSTKCLYGTTTATATAVTEAADSCRTEWVQDLFYVTATAVSSNPVIAVVNIVVLPFSTLPMDLLLNLFLSFSAFVAYRTDFTTCMFMTHHRCFTPWHRET